MNQHTLGPNGHAAAFDGADDWARFLCKHMKDRWDNLTLAKEIGVDRSQVSRWLRHEGTPSAESVRAVCRAFRVDVRYGIVAAGLFTAEEMKLGSRPSTREVLRGCKPEELTAEILTRMTGGAAAPVEVVGRGTFTEQRQPVVGATLFHDGRHAV